MFFKREEKEKGERKEPTPSPRSSLSAPIRDHCRANALLAVSPTVHGGSPWSWWPPWVAGFSLDHSGPLWPGSFSVCGRLGVAIALLRRLG